MSLLPFTHSFACTAFLNSLSSGSILRADSRFAPSQWETALLCNDVSYWLGANLESTLHSHLPEPSGFLCLMNGDRHSQTGHGYWCSIAVEHSGVLQDSVGSCWPFGSVILSANMYLKALIVIETWENRDKFIRKWSLCFIWPEA